MAKGMRENSEKNEKKVEKSMDSEIQSSLANSLDDFNKLSAKQQKKYSKISGLAGKKQFIDQFYNYWKKKNGDEVLPDIDRKKFELYFNNIKDKGLKFDDMMSDEKPHILKNISSSSTEEQAVHNTLGKLKNAIGNTDFANFATYANFDRATFAIGSTTRFKSLEEIKKVWIDYLNLSTSPDYDSEKKKLAMNALDSDFDYTEKMMIVSCIDKIKDILPPALHGSFNTEFPKPTILDGIRTLNDLKSRRDSFFAMHGASLTQEQKQKLKELIITSGDIKKSMDAEGLDTTNGMKGRFSSWSSKFRVVYDKMLTSKYFEELIEQDEIIDQSINNIYQTFKKFPPYFSRLTKEFPYNPSELRSKYPDIDGKMIEIEDLTSEYNDSNTSEERKSEIILEKEKKEKELQKIEWDSYINEIITKDPAMGDAVKEVIEKDFDFSELQPSKQQKIVDVLIKSKLKEVKDNAVLKHLGIDENGFEDFVNDLMDLNKMDVDIPLPDGGTKKIKFKSKKFLSLKKSEIPKIKDIGDLKNIPLDFEVDPESADFFENSDILGSNLFMEFDGTKIHENYKVTLSKGDEMIGPGYLTPYTDQNDKNEEKGTCLVMYSQPANTISSDRKIVKDKSGNSVKICPGEEEQYKINIPKNNKNINLNGDSFGLLLLSYCMGASDVDSFKGMDEERVNKLKDDFGKIDTFKDKKEFHEGETKEEEETDEKKEFMKQWEDLPGFQFENDEKKGFRKGTRLAMPFDSSGLPPKKYDADQFVYIDILDVDEESGKFKARMSGTEKMGTIGTKRVPMTGTVLQRWKKLDGSSTNKIYKLPKSPDNLDFKKHIEDLKETGMELKGFENLKSVDLNGNNFEYNKLVEGDKKVKYFGCKDITLDYTKPERLPDEYVVKYEVNPLGNGEFDVKTVFVDQETEGKNGKKLKKPKNVKVKYKEKMDMTTLLLLIGQKRLEPMNEEESKETEKENKTVDDMQNDKKFYSIGNLINFVKNGYNGIKDQIKKKSEEKAEDIAHAWVTGDGKGNGLYSKMGMLLGNWNQLGEGFTKMQYEYDKEYDNRIWKKIEFRKDVYENNPNFVQNVLWNEAIPILSGKKKPKERYQIAGLMFAMIRSGGLYNRGMSKFIGKGQYIRLLLGEKYVKAYKQLLKKNHNEAYQRFLDNEKDSGKVAADMDELMDLEIKYIVSVINGGQYKLNPEDEKNKALMRSKKFSTELESAHKEASGGDKFKENYDQVGNISFDFAEFEFNRHANTGRYIKALPFLKKMAEKVNTDRQYSKFAQYMLATQLSGALHSFVDESFRKNMQKVCRTRGFLPGLRTRDILQQHKVKRVLAMAVGEDEVEKLKYVKGRKGANAGLRDFKIGDMEGYDKFLEMDGGFQNWWESNGNGEKIVKFLNLKEGALLKKMQEEGLPEDDKNILEELENYSLELVPQDIDDEVKYEDDSFKKNIFNLSRSYMDQITKIRDKEFEGTPDDKEIAFKVWTKVSDEFPTENMAGDRRNMEFYMKKMFSWFKCFDATRREQLARSIKLIQNNSKYADYIARNLIQGVIIQHYGGVPDAMRGAIENMYKFFLNNVNNIDENVIRNVFVDEKKEKGYVNKYVRAYKERPYKIFDMEKYKIRTRSTVPESKRELVNRIEKNDYLNLTLKNIEQETESERIGQPRLEKKSSDDFDDLGNTSSGPDVYVPDEN